MLPVSAELQFLILWFKPDQKRLKVLVKGRAIKKKVIKSFNITFANKTECPTSI